MRIALASALFLGLSIASTPLWADEIKGTVKSVDPTRSTITVAVGDETKTFAVAGDARITGLFGKKLKKATTQEIAGGLKGVKEGAEVTVFADAKDGKTEVSQIKVEGLQAKVKKKKNKS